MISQTMGSGIEYSPASREAASDRELDKTLSGTKWLFVSLCCYLLSQCFTIPLIGIGSSWVLWPTFSDIAVFLLVVSLLFNHKTLSNASPVAHDLLLLMLVLVGGSIVSYALLFTGNASNTAVNVGAYQVYRVIQFVGIYYITTKIPLPIARVRTLRRVTTVAFLITCAGVMLTYFGLLSPEQFSIFVPRGAAIAGPWEYYFHSDSTGLGTIGYNHGYVGLQITMLLGLRLHLSSQSKSLFDTALLALGILCCFLSESRADLAALLVFACIMLAARPLLVIVTLLLITIGVLAAAILPSPADSSSQMLLTLERQLTLTDPAEDDNLSGRTDIWSDHIAFLNENPTRWLIGGGFGTAAESTVLGSGSNAHMLYLQIVVETGLIGLFAFLVVFYRILRSLYRVELQQKPLFWVTFALLVSSLTQETFYPVPAFEHFLGFYLCSVAMALRTGGDQGGKPGALSAAATDSSAVMGIGVHR